MELGNVKLTTKATQLIKYADNIAKKNGFDAIHPIHLFLGSLKFDDEINLELKRMALIDEMSIISKFKISIQNKYSCKYEEIKDNDLANINISILTRNIIFEAKRVTELHEEHGQIFVSDGQILKAVLESEDEVTKECLRGIDKDLFILIMATPRDMIVDLNNKFIIDEIEDISIIKVTHNDKERVRKFVLNKFYERWAKTIDYGLELENIPIYIAVHGNKIVGFAGYDISKGRKKVFGPIGVLKEYRDKKIGEALVKACLIDMKQLGYKNCIIGNAGSIEFYEKACEAKVVPILNKL